MTVCFTFPTRFQTWFGLAWFFLSICGLDCGHRRSAVALSQPLIEENLPQLDTSSEVRLIDKSEVGVMLPLAGSTFHGEPASETISHQRKVPSVIELLGLATFDDALLRAESATKWEADIQKLERLDQAETYPEDAILVIGSSSVRLWDTIEEDLAPFRPIRRGFGGSKTVDLAVFGKRLIQPHRYSALVVFVANDVSGEDGKVDFERTQVAGWTEEVVAISKAHQPTAPILWVEITPTEKRWHVREQQRELNRMLQEMALTESNFYFLQTAEYFLNREKKVRAELFVEDRLHLNREGYRLWGALIRRRLQDLLSLGTGR